MRSTVIVQKEGYLGPFPRSLGPEDTQLLIFSSLDIGPFWMSDDEKEESRIDKHLGSTTAIQLKIPDLMLKPRENGVEDALAGKSIRQLRSLCTQHGLSMHKSVSNLLEQNRSELEMELRGRGVSTKGKNKRELIEICKQHRIAITKNVENIKEGWEGKPKAYCRSCGSEG
ncbi:hypothetical protein MHU86_43 [Fragilaria crotonensis]|nr:hypothetical protein MHU86_43 [Fragilaria crotonensis]